MSETQHVAEWVDDRDPYFVRPEPPEPPAYVEFRLGDDLVEFGILDRRYGPRGAANAPGRAVAA